MAFLKVSLMAARSPSPMHYGWLVVLASMLGLGVGVQSVTNYTAGLFFKPLAAQFGWSLQQASVAFLILNHGLVFASPFAGRLIDQKSGRILISLSTALAGAGFVSLYFLSNSLIQYYATFAIIAVLGCFTTPLAYAKLISRWFDKRLGLALGFMTGGVGIGSALLPGLTLALLHDYGWRTAYVGLGLTMIGMAPLLAIMLRDSPQLMNLGTDGVALAAELEIAASAATAADPIYLSLPDQGMSLREAASTGTFWGLLIAFALISLGFAGIVVPMAAMLALHGLTMVQVGVALAGMGIANFVSRLGFGWLLDRFDPILAGLLLWISAACCILLLDTIRTPWLLMTIPAAVGLGLGAEQDLLAFLTRRFFGMRAMGQIYGLLFSACILSGAWGAVAISHFLDIHASRMAMQGVFAAIAMGCATLWWVRKHGKYLPVA